VIPERERMRLAEPRRPGMGLTRRQRRLAFGGFPPHISGMGDLTPDDKAAIAAALLRDTIVADLFPISPRVRAWKVILDKWSRRLKAIRAFRPTASRCRRADPHG
jgi:hypothetical protein